MSDCAHHRRALLAEPHATSPELEAHLAGCAECRAYRARLLRFEDRLARALKVDPLPRQVQVRGRLGWLAMAASVLVALVAGATLWLAAPHSSLAADVVAHMAGEPEAWARTDSALPAADLDPVLAAAHVRLLPDAGMVSYAQSCLFRGHRVPHLVVQTEQGPITVMVLTHESVTKAQPFDEEGYRGIILPVPGHGSLAVLGRGREVDLKSVEKTAMRVENAVVWTE
jgi:hypothetical protein